MSLRSMVKSYSPELATATYATTATISTIGVAEVAAVAVATNDSHRAKLLERWHWFLSLATEHGVQREVVEAEFPSVQDKLDLLEPSEHDEHCLRGCMATICSDRRVRDRQNDFESGRWVPIGGEPLEF